MRLTLILILIGFASTQAISQLYVGRNGWQTYFVEISEDSARVEVFSSSPPDFMEKKCDEILIPDSKICETCFSGKQTQILKKRSYYLLYMSDYRKKPYKIRLKLCTNDNRIELRNESYASDKRTMLWKLKDSLLGPEFDQRFDNNNPIREIVHKNLMDSNFRILVDAVSDSLMNLILLERNPEVDYYYQISDSIDQLDTGKIYDLLSSADYMHKYSQYFLVHLSAKRPECLISYIDNNPSNKDSLLRSIKESDRFKEITANVKKSPLKTNGQKEILRQKTKRIARDMALVGLFGAVVLSELGLLTLGIIWIF